MYLWRVREQGGRWYPEGREPGGRWGRPYPVAVRNGYASRADAEKYVRDYIENGAGEWDEQADTLTEDEKRKLTEWSQQADLDGDTATEEQADTARRLEFYRWLVRQGRIGAGDTAADTREPVGAIWARA